MSRWRRQGECGSRVRSWALRHQPRRTSQRRVEAIGALRRLRFSGPEIAELLETPGSTVSAILEREELGKLGRLGREPAERYERRRPGELVHIDVKKLGRIVGGAGHGPIYGSSRERTAALDGWLWHYNHRRRHSAIGRKPPISRLNNLPGTYT